MKLELENSNAKYQIKKYESGIITINNTAYSKTIIITPTSVTEFSRDSYLEACERRPEVILLGTGDSLNMPTALIGNNEGIEIMSTPAACRTYTILANDHRNVMAVLRP